jgi:hypothetical protein
MERSLVLPIGEVPAQAAQGLALTDAVVQGWDLARRPAKTFRSMKILRRCSGRRRGSHRP